MTVRAWTFQYAYTKYIEPLIKVTNIHRISPNLFLIVASIVGFCICSMFCCALLCAHKWFCNHLDGEERVGCFALFVFLVSRDCCVALPNGAMGLSVVCGCGIS